jgi:FkbM family methyltransferase
MMDNVPRDRTDAASSKSRSSPTVGQPRIPAHEVHRIFVERHADSIAQPDDAVALLRIVEEQARDLTKLRRALLASRLLAEQRLEIINKAEAGGAKASLVRMHRMLKRVLRSGWWKIGQRLGIVTGASWKEGSDRSRFVDGKRPTALTAAPVASETKIESSSRHQGECKSLTAYTTECFVQQCRSFATDAILDVGASTGQFAHGLRACGYRGHIVSFEPLSTAHAELTRAAVDDPLWDVAERCAVGAEPGETQMKVAGNSCGFAFSARPQQHQESAADSNHHGFEACRVITLDDHINGAFFDPTTIFGLQMHTDGYEARVLCGLRRNLDRIKVVLCQIPLRPSYAGAPSLQELSTLLTDLGYRCIALAPEFEDPQSGELLQIEGVFVRR